MTGIIDFHVLVLAHVVRLLSTMVALHHCSRSVDDSIELGRVRHSLALSVLLAQGTRCSVRSVLLTAEFLFVSIPVSGTLSVTAGASFFSSTGSRGTLVPTRGLGFRGTVLWHGLHVRVLRSRRRRCKIYALLISQLFILRGIGPKAMSSVAVLLRSVIDLSQVQIRLLGGASHASWVLQAELEAILAVVGLLLRTRSCTIL